jgi:hypothetical protein
MHNPLFQIDNLDKGGKNAGHDSGVSLGTDATDYERALSLLATDPTLQKEVCDVYCVHFTVKELARTSF